MKFCFSFTSYYGITATVKKMYAHLVCFSLIKILKMIFNFFFWWWKLQNHCSSCSHTVYPLINFIYKLNYRKTIATTHSAIKLLKYARWIIIYALKFVKNKQFPFCLECYGCATQFLSRFQSSVCPISFHPRNGIEQFSKIVG